MSLARGRACLSLLLERVSVGALSRRWVRRKHVSTRRAFSCRARYECIVRKERMDRNTANIHFYRRSCETVRSRWVVYQTYFRYLAVFPEYFEVLLCISFFLVLRSFSGTSKFFIIATSRSRFVLPATAWRRDVVALEGEELNDHTDLRPRR